MDTTRVLRDVADGVPGAADRLIPLVYQELRTVAARHLAREHSGHSLQPTLLADEVFLKLVDQTRTTWQGREHFFAVAASLIRRILVDHARARAALRRGGNCTRTPIIDAEAEPGVNTLDLLQLDEALEELGRLNDRHRRIVELRYFGGLTIEQTARVLEVSEQTVKADWSLIRAWLRVRLEP